jgi:uncharacterized protein HemY
MVAEDVSEFFSKRLTPRRIAEDERRLAMSVWLLVVLAALAWVAIFATGVVVHELVF